MQVEAYSMDAVLQIFKRSICPGTPFFESLTKKPPTTMDDLFRRANKYSMLEDDVRVATQQILVIGQPTRNDMERSSKPLNQQRSPERKQDEQSHSELPPLTPLTVSHEKLLPMICELSDFRCSRPIKVDPTKRDHNKKCAYHKEHEHTTESPLFGRKAHKSGAPEAVRPLESQGRRDFLQSNLRDPQGSNCP